MEHYIKIVLPTGEYSLEEFYQIVIATQRQVEIELARWEEEGGRCD